MSRTKLKSKLPVALNRGVMFAGRFDAYNLRDGSNVVAFGRVASVESRDVGALLFARTPEAAVTFTFEGKTIEGRHSEPFILALFRLLGEAEAPEHNAVLWSMAHEIIRTIKGVHIPGFSELFEEKP